MLEASWRWFGKKDPISLSKIKMLGIKNIVTALHNVPIGDVWQLQDIIDLKNYIEKHDMKWCVIESVPVHEEIKYGGPNRDMYIQNYIETIINISKSEINILCYNFMPVVDWTRTDLMHKCKNETFALKFDFDEFVAFDIFELKRKDHSYTKDQYDRALTKYKTLTREDIDKISNNITQGLPGSMVEKHDLSNFLQKLEKYTDKTKKDIQDNLKYFIQNVAPVAEKHKVKLCIHPDDPPMDLFGIPRIMSTLEDHLFLIESYRSFYNGITLCVGSLGSSKKNNIPLIVNKLVDHVHFLHLRNVSKYNDFSFIESEHLDGDVNMVQVINTFMEKNNTIPFRPDHGHLMFDEIDNPTVNPGYSFFGRMKGLCELNGIIQTCQTKITYESVVSEINNSKHKIIPIFKKWF